MRHNRRIAWISQVPVVWVLGLTPAFGAAPQTTTTEVKPFEVVSVDGNTVVLKGAAGTKEYTVPETFRVNVDGKDVSVHELKPGMKGTATITTTTTVKPVTVTEVRNAEVFQASGGAVIVRGPKGFQSYTQSDVDKKNIKIMRGGAPIQISELRTGDRLTATIISSRPPQILTDRQVKAALTSAPAATSAGASPVPAPAATAGTVAASTAPSGRRLPKTARGVPAVAWIGLASLVAAMSLTWRRRSARA